MAVLNETAAGERERNAVSWNYLPNGSHFARQNSGAPGEAGLCNLRNLHRTPVAYALLRQIAAAHLGVQCITLQQSVKHDRPRRMHLAHKLLATLMHF
jgi:hypothetical protein